MANPNSNCLDGMRCPSCGSYGPFNIACNVVFLVSDDGTEELGGDHEWDDSSYCMCRECEHTARVANFTEADDAA